MQHPAESRAEGPYRGPTQRIGPGRFHEGVLSSHPRPSRSTAYFIKRSGGRHTEARDSDTRRTDKQTDRQTGRQTETKRGQSIARQASRARFCSTHHQKVLQWCTHTPHGWDQSKRGRQHTPTLHTHPSPTGGRGRLSRIQMTSGTSSDASYPGM